MALLIIDNYDSFTYNIIQLVEQCGVTEYKIIKNDELLLLKSNEFEKVIISPGPGIAREAGELNLFVKKYCSSKSFLGICLGHEAIAELFGAKLIKMPKPWHGIQGPGIVIHDDFIFKGLPEKFNIGHYHSWVIEKETLPGELVITMVDDDERIMAVRHKHYNLIGLQFHPESIMTEYGLEMMGNWLEEF